MNILVTGGASGLGEAITAKLASDPSYKIYFTYCDSFKEAESLEKQFSNVHSFQCDFRISKDLDDLTKQMEQINPDVLVNNAFAGFTRKHFHKIAPDSFVENFRHNIIPVIRITQKAIVLFRKKKFGKIINILTSALINRPPVGWSEYVAGKAYLAELSKSWAVENAAFNITSNCISPSFMKTDLTSDIDERVIEDMERTHPLKQLLSPEEVADSVLFLCRSTQHINGVNIPLNAASDMI
jgi:NAD(P)-dependent dehydrogenase (short-subunit alcohol dehydrogenase family)